MKKLEAREKRNIAVFVEIKGFFPGPRAVFVRTKAENGGAWGHTRECACAFFSCDAYLRTIRYCAAPG